MIGTKSKMVKPRSYEADEGARHLSLLFEQWGEPICAYLYRLLGDWESAHDLTQDCFLRAFQARRQLAGVENPRAWLYRIATNLAYDALRRRRRFAWLPWQQSETAVGSAPSPMERATERADVAEALAALAPEYRAPLLLYSAYGFSVREVAEALGLRESAVKMRLLRAREQFRRAYGEEA